MLGINRLAAFAVLGTGAVGIAGGWAVVTVKNPPALLEAGGNYRLEFVVRAHGTELLGGLNPRVRLAGTDAVFAAASTGEKGRYVATIRVPEGGAAALVVESGFGRGPQAELALLPVPITRRGQAAAALRPAEWGRHLFVAKGCGTCHVNGDIPELAQSGLKGGVGPELTGRRLEPAYVRQRLVDPRSLPAIGTAGVRMPNLELTEPEVVALVAFLGESRVTAAN